VSESLGLEIDWLAESRTVVIANRQNQLPVVGSLDNLKKLLAEGENNRTAFYYGSSLFRNQDESAIALESSASAPASARAQDSQAKSTEQGLDYSGTNVQVQGVDEADLVKTDGQYIFQVNNRRIVVARAYPANDMEITSIINFSDKSFWPRELYLDEKHLVVIGSTEGYYNMPMPRPMPGGESMAVEKNIRLMPGHEPWRSTVKAIVYDISDKKNVKQLREVELEGHYVSSRKIGAALYLVVNKHLDYYTIQQGSTDVSPLFRDSTGQNEFVQVDFDKIRYFPGAIEPNYLMIGALNLEQPEQQLEISTFLGAGQNIYASLNNLYVAVTKYDFEENPITPGTKLWPGPVTRENTVIYKFALANGQVAFKEQGTVPGRILNQFSMDEHLGYFRIATTTGDMWRTDEFTSKNNVYILNHKMVLMGKVEDIAPGERIYSVRFMGDRGYLVTFKTVDPLFVIDLKDPAKPAILGELKIPGYSDYLHPYDENHLIGFGKDAMEVNGIAYYLGMKIALFDVSDVHNPVEKFVEMIGDRGTHSEVLQNHKALLFSREKSLLAFPVTVMEVKGTEQYSYGGIPPYGQFTFQGAYVYEIDLENGFNLRDKITHLSTEDYLRAEQYYWPGDGKNVERLLYINENLYTLSQKVWKVHDLPSLSERKSLLIP
ncbi:MAG: beta-propeller domain-containing protein, partial [Clostridia bacterium]|nr:beta-propeller domain-containing protein [Clostridia bacterium]